MTMHQLIVVLVVRSQDFVADTEDYSPLDDVDVYQVFLETEDTFVEDWMLKQANEHPDWQFHMVIPTNRSWSHAHQPTATIGEKA